MVGLSNRVVITPCAPATTIYKMIAWTAHFLVWSCVRHKVFVTPLFNKSQVKYICYSFSSIYPNLITRFIDLD